MLHNYCTLLLFCFVAVHGKPSEPPVPSNPIGPFDNQEDTIYTSPSGKSKLQDPTEDAPFEGDILRHGGGVLGNAGSLNPWPNAVIPYRFDCSVENIPSAIKATKDAMKVWEQKTCIRFVEKRPEDKAFLELFRAAGCWATFVGYRKDTKTQISIGSGCDYKHVMEHELGHVIGFWHEQSRKDRDDYISIDYSNVVPELKYNFDIVKSVTSNYGHAYDYGSIMHYPWNAFAINRGRPTITARKPLNGKVPYVGLSDVDAAQANNMYKCTTVKSVRGVQVEKMKNASAMLGLATTGSKCVDKHESCSEWAGYGQCNSAANYMLTMCPKSCDNCGPCKNNDETCEYWKDEGFCATRPDYMFRNCKVSCKICIPECVNKYYSCEAWAAYGFCKRLEVYMTMHCPKACNTCGKTVTRKTTPKPTIRATTRPTTRATTKPTTRATTKPTTQATTPKTTKSSEPKEITLPKKKFTGIRCVDRSTNCKAWEKTGRCDRDRWVMDNCLLSCKRFDICDPAPFRPTGTCTSPLGVGWDNKLPNRNFYGTSVFVPGGGWAARAYGGRLYMQDNHARKEVGAWCARPRSKNQYLQIDLGEPRTITAVATQGRDRYFEHVKSYSLSFSDDRRTWREYQEQGEKKVFDGNCDHFTPVMNLVKKMPVARYIRFHPIKFIGAMCLRVEVYGC